MWVIVLFSVTAVGTFFERLFVLHRASIPVREVLRGLANLLRKENYAEALQECATTPGPVSRVAHAIILHHDAPRADLQAIAQEAGQLEVPRLERNMPLLAAVAYGTPLLGLLGTLMGLLTTFDQITRQSGYATATDIAEGVYVALLTTTASLAVALPAFLAYSFLSARINSLVHDMERTGIEILAILDEVRGRKKPPVA